MRDTASGITTFGGVRIDLRWSAADAAAWQATLAIDAAFNADTLLTNAGCSIPENAWVAIGNPLEGTSSTRQPGASSGSTMAAGSW